MILNIKRDYFFNKGGDAPPFASRSEFARLIPRNRAFCALRSAFMLPTNYCDDRTYRPSGGLLVRDLRAMWRPKVAEASSRCAEASSLRHFSGIHPKNTIS